MKSPELISISSSSKPELSEILDSDSFTEKLITLGKITEEEEMEGGLFVIDGKVSDVISPLDKEYKDNDSKENVFAIEAMRVGYSTFSSKIALSIVLERMGYDAAYGPSAEQLRMVDIAIHSHPGGHAWLRPSPADLIGFEEYLSSNPSYIAGILTTENSVVKLMLYGVDSELPQYSYYQDEGRFNGNAEKTKAVMRESGLWVEEFVLELKDKEPETPSELATIWSDKWQEFDKRYYLSEDSWDTMVDDLAKGITSVMKSSAYFIEWYESNPKVREVFDLASDLEVLLHNTGKSDEETDEAVAKALDKIEELIKELERTYS